MTRKDYYITLRLTRSASITEIRRAYRKLALEYHPDHHPEDPEAEEKFKEISEAYSVLGNPQKREDYDLGRLNIHNRDSWNTDGRYRPRRRGAGRGRRPDFTAQKTILNVVQLGQTYEFLLTPEEAQQGTERLVLIAAGTKQKGFRIHIPAGVNQGTQFKAILGRDESRYIQVRISILR
jgi:curved DNA-binding protein CbpA